MKDDKQIKRTNNGFWLLERGQAEGLEMPLWWAGGDRWVANVNDVPEDYRFETIHHAKATIVIEREEREPNGWPWRCRITEHAFMGTQSEESDGR